MSGAGVRAPWYVRTLLAIVLANFFTLVALNLGPTPVAATGPVYLLALAAAAWLIRPLRWRAEPLPPDPWPWIMAGAAWVLLTVPRLAYPLEWIPGNNVAAAMDDYARVPEIATMVLSPHYPLQHPANPGLLFSFFYSSLYPMAALKLLIPVLTVKDVLFLGNALYHALILSSLVWVARLVLRDRDAVRVLMFLVCLFGGLDWIATGRPFRLQHSEWWQGDRFHANTQISSFYVSLEWAIHHTVGFYTFVLAYVTMFHARAGRRLKSWVVTLLVASAFYASPFSAMSVPLFALAHRRVVWRRLLRTLAAPVVLLAATVPLYIFLDKPSAIHFTLSGFRLGFTGTTWVDKLLSLPLWLTLVPLVEFGGIPFLLLLVWRRLSRGERAHLAAAGAFFLVVYWVAFVGANDFCMRGMVLPTFALYAVFARHAGAIADRLKTTRPRRVLAAAVVVIAACGVVGTLKESYYSTWSAVYKSTLAWDLLHRKDMPDYLRRLRQLDSRAIARDRQVRTVPYSEVSDLGYAMYSLEKLVDRKPLDRMERGELELARFPRRGYFR